LGYNVWDLQTKTEFSEMESYINKNSKSTHKVENKQESWLQKIKLFAVPLAAGVALNFVGQAEINKNFALTEKAPTAQEQVQNQIKNIENTGYIAQENIQNFTQKSIRQALNLDKLHPGESLLEKSENFIIISEAVLRLLSTCIPVYKILTAKKTIRDVGTKEQGDERNIISETFDVLDIANWLAENVIEMFTKPENFYFNLLNVLENSVDLTTKLAISMKIMTGKGNGEDLNLSDLKSAISGIKENVANSIGVESLQPKDLMPYLDKFRQQFPGQIERFMEEIIKNPNSYNPETWKNAAEDLVSKFKQVLPESLAEKLNLVTLVLFIFSMFVGDGVLPFILSIINDTKYNFLLMKSRNAPSVKTIAPDIATNALWAMQDFSIYSVYGIMQLVVTALGMSIRGAKELKNKPFFANIKDEISRLLKQNGPNQQPTSRPEVNFNNVVRQSTHIQVQENAIIQQDKDYFADANSVDDF
jgi:hypothetical protein